MKLLIACLTVTLALPCSVLAAARPLQSEPVDPAMPSSPAAPVHHPLFDVRYVLVSATPAHAQDSLPVIHLGSPEPAIHSMSLNGDASATLGERFRNSNVELCHGWGCETQPCH